ncbi:MAG TPA: S46 family peptidase [Bacteroidales bacterium]|nr:S46 family peptidase [Bacteroidales bacterium]HPS15813.1 S46 family peptidase [Bacteroidales bacterium]
MKKLFLIVALLSCNNFLKADEGMWLPMFIQRLNYVDMQKMGCHLTAEEIYSVNHSSIKDAIVSVNYGDCTGEMVSPEGLLMTAHHCGIYYIQNHSTLEKDYLKDGFWAASNAEEQRNDKLTATFLISIEDVTGKILPYLNDKMTETKRNAVVDSLSAILENAKIKGTTYDAKVESFYNGNEYYLFVTETYKDVRLVGAPPESLGLFGGETDNWMWPRHTVDFSLFRIYMSPDKKPAGYSKKNIPYMPKHYLPISLKGVKKDDFEMVLGYPDESERYITSYGIKILTDRYCAAIIKNREKRLSIIGEDMKASEEVNIQYSSEFLVVSNYYKFFNGLLDQLQKLKVYDKKVAFEKTFTTWYSSNPVLKAKYGNVLNEIKDKNDTIGKYVYPLILSGEGIRNGIKILSYAKTFTELNTQLKNGSNTDSINKRTQSLTYAAKQFFREYNLSTDKKICLAMLKMYYDNVSKEFYPDVFTTIEKKYKGDISAYVNEMYDKSIFASKDKILEFLITPDYKKLEKDIGYITMLSFNNKAQEIRTSYNKAKSELAKSNRLYVAGIMEMNKDKKNYPDANHTLRLNYGKVTDLTLSTGKKYNYYTTLDEMIAKGDTSNPEFTIPPKLKSLYESKDYGKYADNGVMKVCFITNNDCTGGNSGSPIINGDGELTGILFDGNWESVANDYDYNAETQRAICVDIRFVLFIIDKYAGASNIIKELSLKE